MARNRDGRPVRPARWPLVRVTFNEQVKDTGGLTQRGIHVELRDGSGNVSYNEVTAEARATGASGVCARTNGGGGSAGGGRGQRIDLDLVPQRDLRSRRRRSSAVRASTRPASTAASAGARAPASGST